MNTARYLDNVVWEITLRCNARCVHCGSAAGKDRPNNLTAEEIKNLCRELELLGCEKVNLIGGEAFLHPLWREIIADLRQKHIEVSIITNALSLNPQKIDFLQEKGVATLGISLDGATAELHDKIRQVKGIYRHIFSLSDALRNSGMYLVAITTLNRFNITQLKLFRDTLPATFFHAWQIQIGAPFGRMKEDLALNELEYYAAGVFLACTRRKFKKTNFDVFGMHDFGYYSKLIPCDVNIYGKEWEGCPAGKYLMGIRSDGKIYGCLSAYDDCFIEGDVRQQTLQEIWNSPSFCHWNGRFEKNKNLKGYCAKCPHNIACCAGCTDIAYSYSGSAEQNPLCYHAIEHKYEKYRGNNEYKKILRTFVNGKITRYGNFYMENNKKITAAFIKKIKDKRTAELLSVFL